LHLRYLGLAETGILEVPEEVGKLQFLQVLDLRLNYGMKNLPSAIIKLRRLMCLLIGDCGRIAVPDGLGNLASMEVLSEIHVSSPSTVKELGNMKMLRKLNIEFGNFCLEMEEVFVESLGKLSNIQSLNIYFDDLVEESAGLLGNWVPPPSLRRFVAPSEMIFPTLPAWIRGNPPHHSKLSKLVISVEQVGQEYMEILAGLPALCSLALLSRRQCGLILIGSGFHCLTSFWGTFESGCEIVFQAGAMPKAERVQLIMGLRVTNEEATGIIGLSNMPSLRNVCVNYNPTRVTVGQAIQAADALEKAIRAHPNSPTFQISFFPDIPEGT
jgi:disease resistance protein RPM1